MITRELKKKSKKKSKPMKFMKKIIVLCITFIVLYTILQSYLNYVVGMELSPTLTTCVYAFFGTELAASALIKILDRKSNYQDNDTANQEDGF